MWAAPGIMKSGGYVWLGAATKYQTREGAVQSRCEKKRERLYLL